MADKTMRAVRFGRYGGPEELQVTDVPYPTAGPGRAVELGVPTDRIDTIIDWPAAGRTGAKAEGMASVKDPAAVMTELAALVAAGQLIVPIARTYPLEQVQDAYRELAQRHTRGKIVLLPG